MMTVVGAKDVAERDSWKAALQSVINNVSNSLRGYVTKVVKNSFLDKNQRKFFILHDKAITYHQNHESTSVIQGMMKLSAS